MRIGTRPQRSKSFLDSLSEFLFHCSRNANRDFYRSADLDAGDVEELGQLFEVCAAVAYADGAVVGWGLRVPLFNEVSRADGEAVAAVGVADFEDWAGLARAFCD